MYSQLLVFLVQPHISLVIHRIIRFVPGSECRRIFAGDHRMRLLTKFEMFMFDNTGIRNLSFTIINDRIPLIIFHFQTFVFKTKTTVFQMPETKIVILVNTSGKQYFIHQRIQFFTSRKIIRPQTHISSFKQTFNQFIVSAFRNTLILVIKIIIIINETERKSFYNKGRKLRCRTSPLFFRISLD